MCSKCCAFEHSCTLFCISLYGLGFGVIVYLQEIINCESENIRALLAKKYFHWLGKFS